jgi:VWFA-related protein
VRRVLVAGVLAAALPAAAQEIAVFASRTDVVYVDVFVTRGGIPVRGLAAESFEVRDDGARREVQLLALEKVPLEARLVFDVSASLEGERLEHLRAAGRSFLAGLRRGDRVGLVTFGEEIRVPLPPTDDPTALYAALDGLRAGGMTALYDGLYAALELDAGPGRRMVVVFSDGADTISWLGEKQVARVAEESNVLVEAIAVRPGSSTSRGKAAEDLSSLDSLREIAERTGGRLWLASSSEDLESAFGRIVEAMKSRYILRLEPRGPLRPGRHLLEVRLKGPAAEVRHRPTYFVAR